MDRIATMNSHRRCTLPANHPNWGAPPHLNTVRCPGLQARIHLCGRVLFLQGTLQRRGCIIPGNDHFHQLKASIVPKFSTIEKFSELLLIGHLVRSRRRRLFGIIENAQ